MKQRPVQKLVAVVAAVSAIAFVTEGYLRVRDFVVQTQNANREIAVLKHDLQTLKVVLDNTPLAPSVQARPALSIGQIPAPVPLSELPLPDLPPPKASTPAVSRAIPSKNKNDKPDDEIEGIVLLNDFKNVVAGSQPPAAQARSESGLDVKLLDRK
jgi:hypothetical protein